MLFYVILLLFFFLVYEFREIVFNLYSCILSSLLRPYSVQVPLHIVMFYNIQRDTIYIKAFFVAFLSFMPFLVATVLLLSYIVLLNGWKFQQCIAVLVVKCCLGLMQRIFVSNILHKAVHVLKKVYY